MSRCNQCGTEISDNDIFCKKCGAKQGAAQNAQIEESVNNSVQSKAGGLSGKDKKVLLIIGIALLFMLLVQTASCGYKFFKVWRQFGGKNTVSAVFSNKEPGAGKNAAEAVVAQIYKNSVSEDELMKTKEKFQETLKEMDGEIAEAKARADELRDYLPADMKNMKFDSDEEAAKFYSGKMEEYNSRFLALVLEGKEKQYLSEEEKRIKAITVTAAYYVSKYSKESYSKMMENLLGFDELMRK